MLCMEAKPVAELTPEQERRIHEEFSRKQAWGDEFMEERTRPSRGLLPDPDDEDCITDWEWC